MLLKTTNTTRITTLATLIRIPSKLILCLNRPISKATVGFRFFDQIYSKEYTTPIPKGVFGY